MAEGNLSLLQVADLARNFSNEVPVPNLGDGAWHMLTLTSQPDGSLGYRMYVDGTLVGQLNGNQTYVGEHLTTMRFMQRGDQDAHDN